MEMKAQAKQGWVLFLAFFAKLLSVRGRNSYLATSDTLSLSSMTKIKGRAPQGSFFPHFPWPPALCLFGSDGDR